MREAREEYFSFLGHARHRGSLRRLRSLQAKNPIFARRDAGCAEVIGAKIVKNAWRALRLGESKESGLCMLIDPFGQPFDHDFHERLVGERLAQIVIHTGLAALIGDTLLNVCSKGDYRYF